MPLPPKEEARFVFCLCERSEAISREGEFPQSMYLFTLVVGYFAYAQYDVLFLLPPKEEAIYLSLRGNNATAAIPMKKVRILFQRFSALTLDFGEKSEYNNVL